MPKAVGLTEHLLGKYKNQIQSVEVVPSSGGVFEVSADDRLIFSKRAQGRFPEHEEIVREIDTLL